MVARKETVEAQVAEENRLHADLGWHRVAVVSCDVANPSLAAKAQKAKDLVRKLEVLKETLESPTAIEERKEEEENAQSNIAYLASKRAEYGALAADLQAWPCIMLPGVW